MNFIIKPFKFQENRYLSYLIHAIYNTSYDSNYDKIKTLVRKLFFKNPVTFRLALDKVMLLLH